MVMRIFGAILFTAALSACGPLPDIPQSVENGGAADDYVDFVPMDRVVLVQREADEEALETEEALEARIAALKARAGRLRRAEIE
jgi:hypothetical protein